MEVGDGARIGVRVVVLLNPHLDVLRLRLLLGLRGIAGAVVVLALLRQWSCRGGSRGHPVGRCGLFVLASHGEHEDDGRKQSP